MLDWFLADLVNTDVGALLVVVRSCALLLALAVMLLARHPFPG